MKNFVFSERKSTIRRTNVTRKRIGPSERRRADVISDGTSFSFAKQASRLEIVAVFPVKQLLKTF